MTGLYYLNARYYNPDSAVFLSQDSYRGELDNYQTWNLYAYCAGNPIKYVDPSGHWVETAADAASFTHSSYTYGKDPSVWNRAMLVWDTAAVAVPVMPGSYVAKGGKAVVKKVGKKVVTAAKKTKVVKKISKVAKAGKSKIVKAGKAVGKKVGKAGSKLKNKVKKVFKGAGGTKNIVRKIDINKKPNVSNNKLKNIVNDLYKGQGGKNTIGNGTTMDAVRNEILTGKPTHGKFHTQKLKDYKNALQRRLRAGDLNDYDKSVVNNLIEDITKALNGQ